MKNQKNKKRNSKQNSSLPVILLVAGFLIIVAAALWQQRASNAPVTDQDAIPRANVAEAKQAVDSQGALILDVRSAESYAASHVQNSINIPIDELENRMGELDPQRWVITYCT